VRTGAIEHASGGRPGARHGGPGRLVQVRGVEVVEARGRERAGVTSAPDRGQPEHVMTRLALAILLLAAVSARVLVVGGPALVGLEDGEGCRPVGGRFRFAHAAVYGALPPYRFVGACPENVTFHGTWEGLGAGAIPGLRRVVHVVAFPHPDRDFDEVERRLFGGDWCAVNTRLAKLQRGQVPYVRIRREDGTRVLREATGHATVDYATPARDIPRKNRAACSVKFGY